ncbi:MAG TPA: TetR/AcrR family transcriptional regulator [Myxococcota bacterium]|nr:TetR/AcrR family transcriptional regulator [Myxococcota bacterium]
MTSPVPRRGRAASLRRAGRAPALDGRAARSARTRAAIADAVLAFLEEGRLEPTSLAIAARAGIAERTLFHHFADLEALFTEVAERQIERVRERFPFEQPAGTLSQRIDAFVARRAALHEFVTPVRRAALRLEPTSPAIARRLAWARRELRRDVARSFAREVEAAPAARRHDLRGALTVATSWSCWEQLRRHQGLSAPRARAVVRQLVASTLEEE